MTVELVGKRLEAHLRVRSAVALSYDAYLDYFPPKMTLDMYLKTLFGSSAAL